MTCFIINLEAHSDNQGVRATIQRFDGETITPYDMWLIAMFKDNEVSGIHMRDNKGDQIL